jgi:chromosome segregation ATPase
MVGFFPFHVGLDYNRDKIYFILFVMSEKSVERFQKKVETIKSELDEIKKSTEASDIEKKKQDIDKKIYAATEAIDDELSELKKDSDTNKEAITKLEELKKTLDSFAPELSNLKKEVLDTNTKDTKEATKEEGKPSLFAKIFY